MTAAPFTPVDGLILSWLASMPLKSPAPATLGEAARARGGLGRGGRRTG